MEHSLLEVEVWAEFACFTRPEFKVERVSYPMITPSAARGVLESIFWKPEFSWQVREIHILRPRHMPAGSNSDVDALSFYRHFSILRNEVNRKATGNPIFVDDVDTRAQRHTLGLRDVAYLIRADIVLRQHATDDVAKYRDQFRRRVARGQCFARPYLGCREFSCDFAPPDDTVAVRRLRHPEPIPLGTMLFDVIRREKESIPLFFKAELRDGVLTVPEELYRRLN